MIGRQVMGNYTITEELGEGGFGAVYLAQHASLDERMAVKVLHPQFAHQPGIIARFVAEARAASASKHPNIVRVHDVGQFSSGEHYIVLEYLDGYSLDRCQLPLSLDAVLGIMVQVCAGLQTAHDAGIVHRDLKPGNLFVAPQPDNPLHTKVLDFGVAKLRTEALAGDIKTATHALFGTVVFMSPEQLRGAAGVDERSDIYALGAILFLLLTGQRPYQGTAPAALAIEQLQNPTPDPGILLPELPDGWRRVIMAALALDPDARPRTARDLAELLIEATPAGGAEIARNAGFLPRGGAVLPQPSAHTLVQPQVPSASPSTLSLAASESAEPASPAGKPWGIVVAILLAMAIAGGAVALLRGKDEPADPQHQATALAATPGPAPADAAVAVEEPAAAPRPRDAAVLARLVIEVEPSHARVIVDGVELGETPITIERAAGTKVKIRVVARRYRAAEKVAVVGQQGTLRLRLDRTRRNINKLGNSTRPKPDKEESPKEGEFRIGIERGEL